jgi:transposase
MSTFAALDISQETTAVCVVDDTGHIVTERKIATCPEVISSFLARHAPSLDRVGMETGPMAVWLWNELNDRGLPVICIDARHANAALKVRPNKTDRNDAAGLAQIIRIGWFKQVRIKSRVSYELRSLLAAREVLVRSRVKIENETRGLLRTFGVLIGKAAGGFANRTAQIVADELDASPMMRTIISSLAKARAALLERIKDLDRQVLAAARVDPTVRLFMSVPGVGPITALSVASAFDDATRFKRSSSAGAYLGLTPRRYESGEMSRNGRISKHGNKMTRKHLYEAATSMLTRTTAFCALKAWGLRLAKKVGFKKARVGVARKLAVILHAMWKTKTPFRWSAVAA